MNKNKAHMQTKKKMKPFIYIVIRHSPLFWYANMAFTIFAPYLLLYFCDKVFARSSENPFFCNTEGDNILNFSKDAVYVLHISHIHALLRQHNRYFNSKGSYHCYYNIVQRRRSWAENSYFLEKSCEVTSHMHHIYIYIYLF